MKISDFSHVLHFLLRKARQTGSVGVSEQRPRTKLYRRLTFCLNSPPGDDVIHKLAKVTKAFDPWS